MSAQLAETPRARILPNRRGPVIHGQSGTKIYYVWADMVKRCTRPEHSGYKNYGGRGITVCDRWRYGDGTRTGFECFAEDMGSRPARHTIERLDNNKGYEPRNCEWRTRRAQSRNTRRNRTIDTPEGPMLICDAAERCGLPAEVLRRRVRRGWPTKDLFMPKQPPGNRLPRGAGQNTATRVRA